VLCESCPPSKGELNGSDDLSDCSDALLPNGSPWHDADGPEYTCAWYALYDHCAEYGAEPSFGDDTAHIACCACGGGNIGEDVDSFDRRPSFTTMMPSSSTLAVDANDGETTTQKPTIQEELLCAGSRDLDYCSELFEYCSTSEEARMLCPVTCNSCPTELEPKTTTMATTTTTPSTSHGDDGSEGDDGDTGTCLCYQNGSAHQENDLWYSHCGLCFCLNCQPVCTHMCNEDNGAENSNGSCKYNGEPRENLEVWTVSTCEMCYCDHGTTVCSNICDGQ